MLSERGQSQKAAYSIILFTLHYAKGKPGIENGSLISMGWHGGRANYKGIV